MKTISFCRVFAVGVLLSVFIAKTEGFVPQPLLKCWGNPADIVFVLDSSNSIWGPYFKKQLDFVKYMVDRLDIGMGPNQVRIGVETFSNSAHVQIDLAESTDREILKKRINNIRRVTGKRTNIGDALRQLLATMFRPKHGSRPNVKHVAIILTDGSSQKPKETQEAAKACRDANIQLFAIGIGGKIKPSELMGIASKPIAKFYFKTANYDALNQIRDDVIRQTCQEETTLKPVSTTPTTPERPFSDECKNKKADVFFLLDSSSSIQIEDFNKEINVIENIVARFDIGPIKTRVGVSVFGHEYHPILNFVSGANKAEALKKIRNIKYVGGKTETSNALHHVRSHVFNHFSIRPGAERILIVFTDGHSTNFQQTSAEARRLRESGVKIFVVGIGLDVDLTELQDMSSKPSNEFMHTFASFDILHAKSGLLTFTACPVDDCNATQQTDVVFMVSNNNFGKVKTNRILKASAEVIRSVGSRGSFRFGAVFDNSLQDLAVGSITEESQLFSFNYVSIASLVEKLRRALFNLWNFRRVGLLFLDNTIDLSDPQIRKEVKSADLNKIKLYAVIIGEGVNEKLVGEFIKSKERIIKIDSYDALITYLPSQFTKKLCKRSDGKPTFKPVIS